MVAAKMMLSLIHFGLLTNGFMEKTVAPNLQNNSVEKARVPPLIRFFALLLGLLVASASCSQQLLILKESDSPFQHKILQAISNKLKNTNQTINLDSQDIESISRKQIMLTAPDLIITLGSKAARSQTTEGFLVLHTLIPESLYTNLSNCNNMPCPANTLVYGLYLDQPVARQLNLIKLLLPGRNSLGLLTAAFSSPKATEFGTLAKKLNYNFHFEWMENEQQLSRKLTKLLEDIDVFIAIPDPLIHNRQTIPHLLLTTYRYNIPVLGFSKAYVNAGAVAAVYSTPEQIAQQITDLIYKILSKSPPPPGNYANKSFEVAINRNVVRSLGLNFTDEQTLKSKLLQLEQ